MDGALQARIKPHDAPRARDYSDAKVVDQTATDIAAPGKTSFKDLLMNSNADTSRTRAAQQNGGELSGAKTDDEFRKVLSDRANKDVLRVPQNNLDKDAFLKLFVTQMQNQDPLNPDDSSQMAAQLAQFNGLEQMLNVNKNLEKMQGEQALSRNVSLINFVGKDVKLDGGKLRLSGGKLTDATFKVEKDAPNATLEVRDAAGVLVGTEELGFLKQGERKVEWQGVGKDGKKVPDGVYTFSVVAKDLQGQDIPVKVTSSVRITGVDLKDNSGSFYTDLGKVRISEVASVGDADFAETARAVDEAMTKAKKKAPTPPNAPAVNPLAAMAGDAEGGVPPEVIEAAAAAAGLTGGAGPMSGEAPPAVPPPPSAPPSDSPALEIPVPTSQDHT